MLELRKQQAELEKKMLSLKLELEVERTRFSESEEADFDEYDVMKRVDTRPNTREDLVDLPASSLVKVFQEAKRIFLEGSLDPASASSSISVDKIRTAPTRNRREISRDAERLLEEIKNLPPTELKLTKPMRVSAAQHQAEIIRRNRLPAFGHASIKTGSSKEHCSTDIPTALVAPSVAVYPLPIDKVQSFDDVLHELGVPHLTNPKGQEQPLYMADCRIVSQTLLKDLIIKRAKILVTKKESTKVDSGTQTFVTYVGKQHVAGCVNCTSREDHSKDCSLPYHPGFCRVCGANGFDTNDCIYPHGIEHEQALGRCPGCSRDLSLYCPECPDCNIRYRWLVD